MWRNESSMVLLREIEMGRFLHMMKRIQYGIGGTALFMLGTLAMAQDLGLVVAVKQNPLPVYAKPGNVEPSGAVAPNDLPWKIKASQNDFFRVSAGGKDVWIDALDVRANRQSVHHCTKAPGSKDTAGSPGAAGKNC